MYTWICWGKSVTCPKFRWQALGNNSFSSEEFCPPKKAGGNSKKKLKQGNSTFFTVGYKAVFLLLRLTA